MGGSGAQAGMFFHTPWDGSHPLFRIGLALLEPSNWIEPDETLSLQLAEKERLLGERRDDVFVEEPGTLAAQSEALERVVQAATLHFPQVWRRHGSAVSVRPAGRMVDLDGDEPPLIKASRLVQEDLVLMRRGEGAWRLAAACVCFPSSWRLKEKAFRPIAQIHAPVPGFGPGSRNGGLIERIFDKLQPAMPVWRMNWSIYADNQLFHGEASGDRASSGELESRFLRVERQTLTKLPVSGDILFTIRIHVDAASLIATHPERRRLAAGLAAQIRALDAAQLSYKGMTGIADRLLAGLDALAERDGAACS